MPESRNQSEEVPKVVRSVGDYGRVRERIMEITQQVGRPPQLNELGNLLLLAADWEEQQRKG